MKKLLIIIIVHSSLIFSQPQSIVSLTDNNYWIYNNESSEPNGNRFSFTRVSKVICDTLIQNKVCKKIEITNYMVDNKTISYQFWYSDNNIYAIFNGSEFYNYYNTEITRDTILFSGTVSTQGYVESVIRVGTQFIMGDYYKTQTRESSSSRSQSYSTYSEKFGYVNSCGTSMGYYSDTDLTGAKIDNVYYGKLPPPLITESDINSKRLDIEFELMEPDINLNKIIFYMYNNTAYGYVPIDSIYTSSTHIYKTFVAGNYNLKFSYKTEEGDESSLSSCLNFTILPSEFLVYQNYPNPFNGQTKIPFETKISTEMNLKIFNILGEEVYEEIMVTENPGYYEFTVNLSDIPSGVYLYNIASKAGKRAAQKMVLIK